MITSLSLVQSEADIIEFFVRSNLELVDHMVVILNPSEDGTDSILYELVREGLPLTIWPTPKNRYAQSEVMTTISNRIRDQMDPDYLIPLDADEVLLCDGLAKFSEALSQIPPDSIGLVPWATFIPPKNEQSYAFNPDEWRYRLSREVTQYYKVVIPRSAAQGEDIHIPNGLHKVLRSNGEMLGKTILDGVHLAHLPVRSIPQIQTKTYSAILSKGIAEGSSWRGVESFQRETVLSYLESEQSPDTRHISKLYLARDWNDANYPGSIIDERLPQVSLSYRNLVRQSPPAEQLFNRILHSIYPLADCTQHLETRSNATAEDADAPDGIFSPIFHANNLKCDWPPFGYLERRFRPKSVVDVGCGWARTCRFFAHVVLLCLEWMELPGRQVITSTLQNICSLTWTAIESI